MGCTMWLFTMELNKEFGCKQFYHNAFSVYPDMLLIVYISLVVYSRLANVLMLIQMTLNINFVFCICILNFAFDRLLKISICFLLPLAHETFSNWYLNNSCNSWFSSLDDHYDHWTIQYIVYF